MEALISITSFLGDLDKYWEDPAWIFAALVGGLGILGLLALVMLYPISRDTDTNPNP
jgi:hypothetical protein